MQIHVRSCSVYFISFIFALMLTCILQVEIDESLQKDGKKTWMLRDIFHKCGIIDRDGNIYEGPDCDTEEYKYCYGSEMAAIERGLERKSDKKSEAEGKKYQERAYSR